MIFTLSRKTRVGIAVVVIAKLAWSHRNDEWVKRLQRPEGPARVDIKFDNGSVRDQQPSASTDQPQEDRSAVGKLKKCLRKYEVTYTDQHCPTDAKVASVKGGTLTVLGGTTSKAESAHSVQQGHKALRDALDLSGNDNIKDKMMERTILR